MFDLYEPTSDAACPSCGSAINEWQGKSGPCAMFVWRQGERHPVDQPIDDPSRIERDRLAEFSLPDTFTIWGYCSHDHGWSCECRCTNGVWTNTGPLQPMPAPGNPR